MTLRVELLGILSSLTLLQVLGLMTAADTLVHAEEVLCDRHLLHVGDRVVPLSVQPHRDGVWM